MKKILTIFIILTLILSLFIACNNANEEVTKIKDGKYTLVFKENNKIILPWIIISNEHFTFIYDALSSYMNAGTYKIEGDVLILNTSDGKFTYCFRIDGDSLFFIQDKSDIVAIRDNRIEIEVVDGSEFKLTEESK